MYFWKMSYILILKLLITNLGFNFGYMKSVAPPLLQTEPRSSKSQLEFFVFKDFIFHHYHDYDCGSKNRNTILLINF